MNSTTNDNDDDYDYDAWARLETALPPEASTNIEIKLRDIWQALFAFVAVSKYCLLYNMSTMNYKSPRVFADKRRLARRERGKRASQDGGSMKHRSAPKESAPKCLSPWGRLGDTPPIRNKIHSWAPRKTPKGTNTKVTSAKGHFCAYPSGTGADCSSRPVSVPRFWISEGLTRAES